MALKCCSLASGSSGNSIFVASRKTRVLIDVGISYTRIRESLLKLKVNPHELDGIVITHEHTDHITGVSVCARTMRCPVYINNQTLNILRPRLKGTEEIRPVENNRAFSIGDLHFRPFSVLHDAVDPMGLVISDGRMKLGIVTDLGKVTNVVREELRHSHILVMEANHDEKMLCDNPRYPWSLKQRIKSSYGHLSNEAAGELLADIAHDGLQALMIAHISRENNHPWLVMGCMQKRLAPSHHPKIMLLEQEKMSELVEV